VKVTPATPGADPGGGGPEADPLAGGLAAARWARGCGRQARRGRPR